MEHSFLSEFVKIVEPKKLKMSNSWHAMTVLAKAYCLKLSVRDCLQFVCVVFIYVLLHNICNGVFSRCDCMFTALFIQRKDLLKTVFLQ